MHAGGAQVLAGGVDGAGRAGLCALDIMGAGLVASVASFLPMAREFPFFAGRGGRGRKLCFNQALRAPAKAGAQFEGRDWAPAFAGARCF
ncbi:hypothetical protein SJA_C1-09680 [Sphingobium indicum UT26S]|uniref:Uncharacterized protein n=1 Tax=Sphingobium indicum (strain DSM 16413 / CCM 7287 / MTCC 6362 / UT26 / NBRC 101211 / UT26S) TaxID=452662 RepID=D4YZM0_SPHIU|nr:hypothetical protein SJA_C1-09680 [Sphingobium indicum UT26S]